MREEWSSRGVREWMIPDWTTNGFEAVAAGKWSVVGYTPAGAKVLADLGARPDDAQKWNKRGWREELMVSVLPVVDGEAFRSGRWDDVLNHWGSSAGYMLDAGFSIEDTERWWAVGTSPADVEEIVSAGGTVKQAEGLVSAGLASETVAAAVRRGLHGKQAVPWVRLGLPNVTLAALLDERATPALVRALLDAGASPEQIRGLPLGQLSRSEALAWLRAGLRHPVRDYLAQKVTSPAEARLWDDEWLRPSLIGGFVEAGVSPEEAGRMVRSGFTDRDARAPDSPPLAGVPWSTVFRRSSTGPESFFLTRVASRDENLQYRFWYAVDSLTIEAAYTVGVFSSSSDGYSMGTGIGKVVSVEGYGWGSHSGTWVVGNNALRLVCRRMGLAQPRRLAGEASRPDVDQLEELVHSARSSTP